MDLYDLLKAEHVRLRDMFRRTEIAGKGEAENRAPMLGTLARELVLHADAEESFLYSRLRANDESREAALQSLGEHKDMRRRLSALQGLDAWSPGWMEAFIELRDAWLGHFAREERDLLPRARRVLDGEEAAGIAEDIETFKEEHSPAEAS